MRNIFLFIFIGFPFVFYGQNNQEHSQDSLVNTVEKYSLQGKEYWASQQMQEDFLEYTYHFPKEFASIGKDISLICEVDSLFASYATVDSITGSTLKHYYYKDKPLKGVDVRINHDKIVSYILYDTIKGKKEYSVHPYYNIDGWVKELIYQDFTLPIQEQPLDIEPMEQQYRVEDDFMGHGQRILTTCYSLIPQELNTKDTSDIEYVILKNYTANRDNWIIIAKKSGLIWVYDMVFNSFDNQFISMQKARINNIGFDQKRVIVFKEDKQFLWGAYFEPTRNATWKKANQFEFDYIRKSDKKPITARVVVDYKQELDTPFYKIVLALAHNPEFFKITTSLQDVDFSNICNSFDLPMKEDFKNTYIVKENL